MRRQTNRLMVIAVLMTVAVGACGKKPAPVARPMPPPSNTGATTANVMPPPPPTPVAEPTITVPPMPDDSIASKSLDDLNRDSPLRPLFFELDSAEVSADGQRLLQENAAVMKKYPAWQITIEGHCDERGTREYNLALGERRANSAKNFLVSLGIDARRVATISYGKERPDPVGSDEQAWALNRRAVTALQ